MGFQGRIWSVGVVGFRIWSKTQRSTRQGTPAAMSTVTIPFDGGGRQTPRRIGGNRQIVRTIGDVCKEGRWNEAMRILDSMEQRGFGPYSGTCGYLLQECAMTKALAGDARGSLEPNEITFMSILNACMSPGSLNKGQQLHADIMRAGFESDIRVGTALVSMYCNCGSVMDGRRVFLKMPERTVISWNAMIAGLAQHGHGEVAFEFFQQMQTEGIKANTVTYISILNTCASPTTLERGKLLHVGIIKAGFEADISVGNSLVSMYCKCGSLVDARHVFENMPKRDTVSWNVIIGGSAQYGDIEESFELFRQMQQEGVKADNFTFTSILNTCASISALEEGRLVHALIINSEAESDICVGNALLDMYAKCGSVEDARQAFGKIVKQDVISWNAMILGYAQHGHGKEALQLFEQMGVKPNTVTFIGVLSACSHAGLVDEGHHYFLSMSEDHCITPIEKHYGCMVDLLGRAGRLDDAEDLIKKMPFEPGAPVWRALLGACRIHTNVELAERAADSIVKFEPQYSSVYVLLSNIYAAAGRWDAVANVRNLMVDRHVKKEPGRSWIEVNNKVHAFTAEDRSHPQTQKIYAELERLTKQMKEAGYVPDMRFALNDVDQQQKEKALCYHSEKLAIAFGLINTPSGTSVHIFKNLRVCGDCHTATKFISKIVGRDIVARDAIRFHHFKNGVCSCGDYW